LLIDGGSLDNNPVQSLVVEALRQGYKKENINVVSIGTGLVPAP